MKSSTTTRRFATLGVLIALSLIATSCLSTMFDQPPIAKLTVVAGDPYGSVPLEITFSIAGSSDPDGEIVSFSFDFGDGSAPIQGSDLSEPILHIYQQPGTFFARVEVTDDKGKTSPSPELLIAPK